MIDNFEWWDWRGSTEKEIIEIANKYLPDTKTVSAALEICIHAHRGQNRNKGKIKGIPYSGHPVAVAIGTYMTLSSLADELMPGAMDILVSIALLHDVIEDCEPYWTSQIATLNPAIIIGVLQLSHPENRGFKSLNRKTRKRIIADLLALAPLYVKVIKACDRLHNLYSFDENDSFVSGPNAKYTTESIYLSQALTAKWNNAQDYSTMSYIKLIELCIMITDKCLNLGVDLNSIKERA